jgi:CheY-like chemotaxis protein
MAGRFPLRGRTILVIEDDHDSREVTRRFLEFLGAQVVVAADGLEGLVRLESLRPDAVLCDLGMPIMDGTEFARRMRQDPRHRRVLLVALTGRQGDADFLHTWRAGFDAHLVKPVTIEMLSSIARRLPGNSAASANPGA